MRGDRTSRRKQRGQNKSEESKITRRDKMYAFLTIAGIFLAAALCVLLFAFF